MHAKGYNSVTIHKHVKQGSPHNMQQRTKGKDVLEKTTTIKATQPCPPL